MPLRLPIALKLAQRRSGIGLVEQLGNRHAGKGPLCGGVSIIQFSMEWAKARVARDAKRAAPDARDGLDSINHICSRGAGRMSETAL
jgi:hypothetical protein